MNIEYIRDYCLSMDDVTEKTPFGKFARRYDSIVVFYVLDHMFCFADMDDLTSVTVKSISDEVEEIRMNHSSVSDPLNQSLRHWIQLNLNGDVSDSVIYSLVRRAYDIVKEKYQKKKKMKAMRKASRQKGSEWALEVFDKAPYVTVSMTRTDGTPYGLPLSLVRKDQRIFYFHCAGEGEKLDCLKVNPVVSLSAVSKCTPKFEEEKNNYTEYYHSAIAVGKAEIVDNDCEKIEALRLICQRFLPQYMDRFDEAITRSLGITTVVRITLTEPPVGKSKQ